MLVDGCHIHAENHLPIAMLVMHIGVVIHGIGKIRLVCGHAIDETNQRAVLYTRGERGIVVIGVDQQPEMVRISGHACGKAFVACGLRRGEAGGLHSLDRVQILHRCMSNEHGHTLSQGIPNLHISICADGAIRQHAIL